MEASGIWEPYFKPTVRVHSSGFRCFECGYLQIGDNNKAVKKVVIAGSVKQFRKTSKTKKEQSCKIVVSK